jgi:RNA polymerase sigma factor (sigma-70 family)
VSRTVEPDAAPSDALPSPGEPSSVARAAASTSTTPSAHWERVVETLVAQRGDALVHYAYFVSGNQDDAADLVQDALVKTFGRLRNGFTVASAEAYVRRTILNSYLDRGRRVTRWRKIAHFEVPQEIQESPADATGDRIDLSAELQKLTPRERACLVLRYYDDLTVNDIAQTLELSPGTVKRYLSDGLGKMATRLAPGQASTDSLTTGGAHHAR